VDPYETVIAALATKISAFYDYIYGIHDIANYCLLDSAWINFYDMSEPEPRVPTRIDMVTPNVTYSTSVIPTEVACVLSFHGPESSGTNPRRRRGRIYLPGIDETLLTQSPAASYPTFATAWVTRILAAAAVLMNDSTGADTPWSVYSPTDAAYVTITGGWVDNSPDTQRRRSVKASVRTTF